MTMLWEQLLNVDHEQLSKVVESHGMLKAHTYMYANIQIWNFNLWFSVAILIALATKIGSNYAVACMVLKSFDCILYTVYLIDFIKICPLGFCQA